MKSILIKYFFTSYLLVSYQFSFSQEFKNEAGEKEKHFVYEVKQIDEFFERFNNDSSSFIRQIYKSKKTIYNLDRKKLIKSLFNYESKPWNKDFIDSFVQRALSTEMPTVKNWYGDNWFAEAKCQFEYNSSVIDIPVILKIVTDEKKRSKWIVVGIRSGLPEEQKNSNAPIKVRSVKTKFINPANHATNFIELGKAFEDKDHLSDYFDNNFFFQRGAAQFYRGLLNDNLKLLFVREVKYHFLNVNGYIFTVEYFPRESLNSGWLISSLKTGNLKDKERYRNFLLGQ